MSDKIDVKIEADPEFGYKVTDLNTGKEIENIHSVNITINPDEIVTADIKLFPADFSIITQAKIEKIQIDKIKELKKGFEK